MRPLALLVYGELALVAMLVALRYAFLWKHTDPVDPVHYLITHYGLAYSVSAMAIYAAFCLVSFIIMREPQRTGIQQNG